MPKPPAAHPARRNRFLLAALAAAAIALLLPLSAAAAPAPATPPPKMAQVGAPGNPSVGIVPFTDAVYASCAEAAEAKPPCQQVGAVKYHYGIGQLEVTVAQWADFLNTVDPKGTNRHKLYSANESGEAWPRFGQIDFAAGAGAGHH